MSTVVARKDASQKHVAVVKKSRFCGPGCECRDCVNLPVQQSVESESEGEGSEEDEENDTHSDDSSLSDISARSRSDYKH